MISCVRFDFNVNRLSLRRIVSSYRLLALLLITKCSSDHAHSILIRISLRRHPVLFKQILVEILLVLLLLSYESVDAVVFVLEHVVAVQLADVFGQVVARVEGPRDAVAH